MDYYNISAQNRDGYQQIFFWNLSFSRAKDLKEKLIKLGAKKVKIEKV